MKESRRKGIASHPDPESCVASRKAGREALTGAHAGGISSCEISGSGTPTSSTETEGHTDGSANASFQRAPRSQRTQACMETPCARTGNTKQTWISDCKTYTVEYTGERIERSLPREPTFPKRTDESDPWASQPWRQDRPVRSGYGPQPDL